jgi:hypothetical protein
MSWLDAYAGWALIVPSLAVLALCGLYLLTRGLSKAAAKPRPTPPRFCAHCGARECLFESEVFRCTVCIHCHDRLVEMVPFEREFKS